MPVDDGGDVAPLPACTGNITVSAVHRYYTHQENISFTVSVAQSVTVKACTPLLATLGHTISCILFDLLV